MPGKISFHFSLKRKVIYIYNCYLKELQALTVGGYYMKSKKTAKAFCKNILPVFSHLQELHVFVCEEGFDDTCM